MTSSWCSLRLVQHVVDCVCLLLSIVVQGSILDYYLILHNGGNAAWYFWFLADFLVLIAFMAAAVIAYRHHHKTGRMRKQDTRSSSSSRFGSLPLVYIVWFFYSSLLTAKVFLLFKLDVAQSLDADSAFGPQLLKVVLASAALVFLLLVETHSDAEPHSDEQAHVRLLVTSTVFEVFDSVTFLGILFPTQSRIVLTYPLENAVLVLSCANFLLPTLPLYQLSGPRTLGLRLLHRGLHLSLVDVPYFVIRVHLWTLYDHDVTLFLLKNVLAVVVAVRTLVPETRQWWRETHSGKRHISFFGGATELGAVYEITNHHPSQENKKLQDSTEL